MSSDSALFQGFGALVTFVGCVAHLDAATAGSIPAVTPSEARG
jgi:hypothetical protein